MFQIGDFSRVTQVSVRMLRYYDESGLLKPAEVDRFTGYRYYSSRQIGRLNKIVALRDMGFLTAEIDAILSAELDDAAFLDILKRKQEELLKNIADENGKLYRLEKLMNAIGKENLAMNYEVTIKSIPSYKVVSKRGRIPSYSREGDLWQALGEFAGKKRISCSGPSFAIYHDKEHKESDVDVEVAMCVEGVLEDGNGCTFRETEAVPQMASLLVNGPYERIAGAYNTLAEWVEENGYKMNGAARQVCHKGPGNERNPENYLTELQIPVARG